MNRAVPRIARFCFARHGQSEGNAAGLWQGQWDPPLTEQGRAQAAALVQALAAEGVGGVASSDLQRAHETARILADGLGVPLRTEAGLREHDVGAWSAKPHDEIKRMDPDGLARFRSGDETMRPGGGETRQEVRHRVHHALARIAAEDAGPVAIVTHLGILRLLVPGIRLDNTGTVWLGADAALAAARGEAPVDRTAVAHEEGPL